MADYAPTAGLRDSRLGGRFNRIFLQAYGSLPTSLGSWPVAVGPPAATDLRRPGLLSPPRYSVARPTRQ